MNDITKKLGNWQYIFYSFVILLFADGIFTSGSLGIMGVTTIGATISGIIYIIYLAKEKSLAKILLNIIIFVAIAIMFIFGSIY